MPRGRSRQTSQASRRELDWWVQVWRAEVAVPIAYAATQPRMVQVVETAAAGARMVSTVDNVTRQVRRRETGTTFLLGENGVTAIR
jgi:hypothetical protein